MRAGVLTEPLRPQMKVDGVGEAREVTQTADGEVDVGVVAPGAFSNSQLKSRTCFTLELKHTSPPV